jgi:hypothetical protein
MPVYNTRPSAIAQTKSMLFRPIGERPRASAQLNVVVILLKPVEEVGG